MRKIGLDKKQTIIAVTVAAATIILILTIFLYRPLSIRIGSMSRELAAIEKELVPTRNIIKTQDNLRKKGRLLTYGEIYLAIDEITRAGRGVNIDFVSISPGEIEKLRASAHQCLPIYMVLEAEYKDLGIFLGALEELEQSIVTVRSFEMERDEGILPLIRSKLAVDVYLEGGDSGG